MKKIIITEKQRGLLFKNGKFIKMLEAGKYLLTYGKSIEVLPLDQPIASKSCALETLLENKELASRVAICEVGDTELAIHYVNGKLFGALKTGKYAYFNDVDKHEFKLVDISTPEVDESISTATLAKLPPLYYYKIEVAEYEKARLYFDRKFVKLLDSGIHYFWKGTTKVDFDFVDTRLTQMDITGQEILTADKVSIRVNFVANYRITDCIKIATEIDNFEEQMHVAAQLALREYIGKYKLDEILENKDEMSKFVFEKLKSRENDFFVNIVDAGVKDIILPGEIRDIMNTVLVAEKRAQANVITRREEVASTRSLLNTAKLMDENKTLYKLKELEYVERICENVGSISLNGNSNILAQLTQVLNGNNV